MIFEDPKKKYAAAKWAVGVVSTCILVYLAIRHINVVAGAVSWLIAVVFPLIFGVVAALILNVPMCFVERHLFAKTKRERLKKLRRPLAIVLSFIFVAGVFIGVAFLVVPELLNAFGVISSSVMGFVDYLERFDAEGAIDTLPFFDYIKRIDFDWVEIKKDVEVWLKNIGTRFMGTALDTIGSVAGGVVNALIGFVFSVYVLYNKETLKRQTSHFIRTWLSEKTADIIIHISSVCSSTFKKFISGQTTEAVILGSLCAIGMAILRLPYAPMIGALVGVTALIPVIGAFIGTVVGAFMIVTVSPIKAVIFVVFLLVLQQIEGNFIYPRVVGASIKLPAMWVLAAVTVGGNLGGAFGMFLGVPTASAAYSLIREATAAHQKKKSQNLTRQEKICCDTAEPSETSDEVEAVENVENVENIEKVKSIDAETDSNTVK